jgi:cobalt-zinc-cadmium resistance protein CzcA
LGLLVLGGGLFTTMVGSLYPLDEAILSFSRFKTGTSLTKTIATTTKIEKFKKLS